MPKKQVGSLVVVLMIHVTAFAGNFVTSKSQIGILISINILAIVEAHTVGLEFAALLIGVDMNDNSLRYKFLFDWQSC